MFEQIKTEPLHFYQSSCPPQITAQIVPQQQHQATAVLQPNQVQNQPHATVITINDDIKDNLQANVSDKSGFSLLQHICLWPTQSALQHNDNNIMPILVDHIKPEIMNSMPQQIIHQTHIGTTAATQTTPTSSRGSKPQACKVCGKILSSASSYYVHMKLHSGTKPFQCKPLNDYIINCVTSFYLRLIN